MDNYLIYTDAACDMPAHVFKDYDVRTIPMDYILNGETLSFDAADPEHDKRCDELYALPRISKKLLQILSETTDRNTGGFFI